MWVCSYVVAENAIKLRESNFVFFRDLVREVEAPPSICLSALNFLPSAVLADFYPCGEDSLYTLLRRLA